MFPYKINEQEPKRNNKIILKMLLVLDPFFSNLVLSIIMHYSKEIILNKFLSDLAAHTTYES